MHVCTEQFFLFSCSQRLDWRSDYKLSYFPECSVIFWYLRNRFEVWFFAIAHLSLGYHKNQETTGSNSAWESSVKSLWLSPFPGAHHCAWHILPLLCSSHWWQLFVCFSVSLARAVSASYSSLYAELSESGLLTSSVSVCWGSTWMNKESPFSASSSLNTRYDHV